MDKPQVPRAAEILGPGLDALARVRPSAFAHANHGAGRWGDLFVGWEGQLALLLRRLADEVRSSRLALARTTGLSDLAASELETRRQAEPTYALGVVRLQRRASAREGGAIPRGFKFRRDANERALPKVPSAMYEATADVSWPAGVERVEVPIRASRAVAAANAPWIDGAVAGDLPQLADLAFDPSIAVVGYEAAGGSDGQTDDDLRRQAAAYATGQHAPTTGAVLAGALRGTGVHRVALTEVTRIADGEGMALRPAAFTAVTIADVSWASSAAWQAAIAQTIANEFLGHGCVVRVSGVDNVRIRCELTVTLRATKHLGEPSGITAAIQHALRAYFDDRPDWYAWNLAQIRAVVSRADSRILVCGSAAVRALANDAVLPEPKRPVARSDGLRLTHWMLVANGVHVTFTSPT